MVDVLGGYMDDLKESGYKTETVVDKVKSW